MKELTHRALIIEALHESLEIASFSLKTHKRNNGTWLIPNGVFGFPASILLFSIIDFIGSYFKVEMKNDDGIEISFPNTDSRKILGTNDHFYILNHSLLFDCKLSVAQINDLYSAYRCKIIHNQTLPTRRYLTANPKNEAFEFVEEKIISVNLPKLFEIVKEAVERFIDLYLEGNNLNNYFTINRLNQKSMSPIFTSTLIDSLPSESSETTNENL